MKKDKLVWIEIIAVYAAAVTLFGMYPSIVAAMRTIMPRMAAQALIYAAFISIAAVLCAARRIKASGLGYIRKNIGGQIAAGLCIATITIFIIVSLPMMLGADKTSILGNKPASPEIFRFSVLFNLTLAGFGEEFVFRGYMMQRIQAASGSMAAAIVISSLMFGFAHFLGTFSIIPALINTGIGLFYGVLRRKVKNCTTVALGLAHGLHSATVVLLAYILQ